MKATESQLLMYLKELLKRKEPGLASEIESIQHKYIAPMPKGEVAKLEEAQAKLKQVMMNTKS